MPDKRSVFVVHGRSLRARDAMFEFLKALGLQPLDWARAMHSSGRPSAHISDILAAAFSEAQTILVLFTGDDKGRLRKRFQRKGDPQYETEETPQPRLNVIFEAGMAFGHCPKRTILVQLGHKMRPFSDISGIYVIAFDGSRKSRELLIDQLKLAGCGVSVETEAWLTAGDFNRPVHGE